MVPRTIVIEELNRLGLPYYITGSDALSETGYVRGTADTDIVVWASPSEYESVLRPALEARGLYVAGLLPSLLGMQGQGSAGSTWVDLILPTDTAWARSAMERRIRVEADAIGPATWKSAPEDLIAAKLAWSGGRPGRQLDDVVRILRGTGGLDLDYLRWSAAQLGAADALEACIAESAGDG